MFVNNNIEHYKQCALRCPNGKHFFRLPKSEKLREKWLEKLPILTYNSNTRICNNHFSKIMIAHSGRRLVKYAFPDINLNIANPTLDPENGAYDQLKEMIDNFYDESCSTTDSCDEYNGDLFYGHEESHLMFLDPIPRPKGVSWNSLEDYQLTPPSGCVYNIKEVPQFIFVCTAFRVNDTIIMPPDNLFNSQVHTENHKFYGKHPSNKLSRLSIVTSSPKATKTIEPNVHWDIDEVPVSKNGVKYILHIPQENTICRDREAQVNILVKPKTTEHAAQCDLFEGDDEESETESTNTQLEWFNYFMKAHINNMSSHKYECHVCGEIAESHDSNLKHALVHKQSSLLCPQCGRLFSTHEKLRRHEKRMHLGNPPEMKKALRCPKFHCTKAFHSERQLFDHIDDHARGRGIQLKCNKCRRLFPSVLKLHSHKMQRKCW